MIGNVIAGMSIRIRSRGVLRWGAVGEVIGVVSMAFLEVGEGKREGKGREGREGSRALRNSVVRRNGVATSAK